MCRPVKSIQSGLKRPVPELLLGRVVPPELRLARIAPREYAVCFSRVAALQCAALFAALKRDNIGYSSELRSLKRTN